MKYQAKKIFEVYKSLIDDLFDAINKGDLPTQQQAWLTLDINVGNDNIAADALRDSLTKGRLETINRALLSNDDKIIELAKGVNRALLKSHERHEGFSLELFAEKNTARAESDRIARHARDRPAGEKAPKKKSGKILRMEKLG